MNAAGDAVAAFQVNDSQGVQDTIDKAVGDGKSVLLKQYDIPVAE